MIPPKPTDEPTFPTAPLPAAAPAGRKLSRRAAVLLATWTVVVAGVSAVVTAAIVGDDGVPDVMSAPTSTPSIWQDTRTYPDDAAQGPEELASPSPTAKSYAMGEKAKSSGATVVVKKVRESATVTINDHDSETTKTLKADAEAKYVIVETTVYNDGTESFDPACADGISQGLIDAEGRNFDPIEDQYQVKGNEKACSGEEVQPGFKRDAVFVYKVPADARPVQWAFSGSEGRVQDDLALVTITGTSSS
ncbi:DUF4352 domain-containing protein [Streptomyces sp. NPDC004520]|uniref:DUF4352 domain-containing protein n=1 Tax=Streptomyces sp. NPDC004520 TaxID=3364702 RepID=UPI00368F7557